MTLKETIRFEAWVRRHGYNTNKERGRYCEGVVNALLDAWVEAQKGQ